MSINVCVQIHSGNYFCTEYEKSKVIADKMALDAASEGVPIIPLYPGLIYGPGKVTTGNIVARLVNFLAALMRYPHFAACDICKYYYNIQCIIFAQFLL